MRESRIQVRIYVLLLIGDENLLIREKYLTNREKSEKLIAGENMH